MLLVLLLQLLTRVFQFFLELLSLTLIFHNPLNQCSLASFMEVRNKFEQHCFIFVSHCLSQRLCLFALQAPQQGLIEDSIFLSFFTELLVFLLQLHSEPAIHYLQRLLHDLVTSLHTHHFTKPSLVMLDHLHHNFHWKCFS